MKTKLCYHDKGIIRYHSDVDSETNTVQKLYNDSLCQTATLKWQIQQHTVHKPILKLTIMCLVF
jgi:hypothetical protein